MGFGSDYDSDDEGLMSMGWKASGGGSVGGSRGATRPKKTRAVTRT